MIKNHKSIKLIDLILLVLIFAVSLAFFLHDRNVEFRGDDGLMYSYRFSYIAGISVSDLVPNSYTLSDLRSYAWKLLRPFLTVPHGIMPSALYGMLYKVFIWTGVDFNENTFRFPISFTSALACALLFLLLKRNGFGRCISLVLVAMLVGSPLFVSASRGIAGFFIAIIPLTQLIGISSLSALNQSTGRRGQLWAGLGFGWVALADIVSVLCLLALFSAHLLHGFPIQLNTERFSFWLNSLKSRMLVLANWRIWIVPAMVMLWYTAATLASKAGPHLSIITSPFLRLSGGHTTKLDPSASDLINTLLTYPPMLFGEMWILLIPVALWGLWKTPRLNYLLAFGSIATLGYGLLFYLISRYDFWIKNLYQGYLIVPVIISLAMIWRSYYQKSKLRAVYVVIVTIVIIFSFLGSIQLVWRMPLTPNSDLYTDITHGSNTSATGAKAVGYLIRTSLLRIWEHNPKAVMELSGCCNRSGLIFYSGLNNNMDFFRLRLGKRPPLKMNLAARKRNCKQKPTDEACQYTVTLRQINSQTDELPETVKREIIVTKQGKKLAVLVFELNRNLTDHLPKFIRYEHSILEDKFIKQFNKFDDYFQL